MHRNLHLPQGKRLSVYKSGDSDFKAKPVHFNPRIYKSFDSFLDEVSEKVPTRGAVRSIHTPNTGTLITSLDQLQNRSYVAAGYKGFTSIPGGYENIGKPSSTKPGRTKLIRKPGPRNDSITIHLHKNGDIASKPRQIVLSRSDTNSWTQLLQRLNVEPNLSYQPISRLYTPNGRIVTSEKLLENNGIYVAATPNETFRHLPYSKSTTKSPKQSFSSPVGEQSSKQFGSYRQDSFQSIKSSQSRLSGPKSHRSIKSHASVKSKMSSTGSQKSKKTHSEDQSSRDIDSGYTEDRKIDATDEEASIFQYDESSRMEELENPHEDQQSIAGLEDLPTDREKPSNEDEETKEGLQENHDWDHTQAPEDNIEDEEQRYLENQHSYEEQEDEDEDEDQQGESEDEDQGEEDMMEEKDVDDGYEEAGLDESADKDNGDETQEHEEEYGEEGNESSTDEDVSSFFARVEEQKEHLLQAIQEESEDEQLDSGNGSLLSNMGYNSPYYASEKSRPTTQAMLIDYDEDASGLFRARSRNHFTENAESVLDTSATKIELPVDMCETTEVEEVC